MTLVRLVTIHPILVHVTVGAIPLLVVAYWIAAVRRSERWTFTGDVILAITAGLTVLTALFGLVSFFAVDWPGGLAPWSGLHLGFGVASAVLLLAFAAYRFARRRHSPLSGRPALYGALAVAAVVGFTGWIGGEVLVYRSGVAVEAAGGGALAPTVTEPSNAEVPQPDNVTQAMQELRGSWAAVTTDLARMVVDHPSTQRYQRIARHAEHMRQLAHWIATRPSFHPDTLRAPSLLTMLEGDAADGSMLTDATGAGGVANPGSNSVAAVMTRQAHLLEEQIRDVERAAWDRNLGEIARTMGQVTSTCAHCHQEIRWSKKDHLHAD